MKKVSSAEMRAVIRWLLTGEVGSSSKSILQAWLGVPLSEFSYPVDGGDFNRCLKLLADIPSARNGFLTLKAVNPVWAALIDKWDEIEMTFLQEAGFDWQKKESAPKTYKLINDTIRSATNGGRRRWPHHTTERLKS